MYPPIPPQVLPQPPNTISTFQLDVQPEPQPQVPYIRSKNGCPCPCTTLQTGSRAIALFDGIWSVVHVITCTLILYNKRRVGEVIEGSTIFQTVAILIHFFFSLCLYSGTQHCSAVKCQCYLVGSVIQLVIEFYVAMISAVKFRIGLLLITHEVVLGLYIIFLIYAIIVVSFFTQEIKSNRAFQRQALNKQGVIAAAPHQLRIGTQSEINALGARLSKS